MFLLLLIHNHLNCLSHKLHLVVLDLPIFVEDLIHHPHQLHLKSPGNTDTEDTDSKLFGYGQDSVNGGAGKTTYYISANFKDINGTVKQTGLISSIFL